MRHERIGEVVTVLAAFYPTKIVPLVMRWQGREYKFEDVTMRTKDSGGKDYYFSVSDGTNVFTLLFSLAGLRWSLEELLTD